MTIRLLVLLTASFAVLSLPNSALAGSNRANIAASIRAQCHAAIDPKHLSPAQFKVEWAKCKADPTTYK
jgi:hypothetical protein